IQHFLNPDLHDSSMSGVVNYASTDATSVDDLSLPWSDPPERRPLPRSRSTSPAGPPCLRGFLLPAIHGRRSAGASPVSSVSPVAPGGRDGPKMIRAWRW